MAVVTIIAGAYTSTFAASPMGATKQGFNLHWTLKGERIEESDIWGQSLLDIVYRGAQATIDAILKAYASVYTAAIMPYAAAVGGVFASSTPIGRKASDVAAALVLTAVANTSAAAGGNISTLTVSSAISSPDNDFTLLLDSRGRDCPIKFDMLLAGSTTGSVFSIT